MKKGRAGVCVRVLCATARTRTVIGLMFLHTPTIGVRVLQVQRWASQIHVSLYATLINLRTGFHYGGTCKLSGRSTETST
jgi:uncharacterized protein (DUF111 family)